MFKIIGGDGKEYGPVSTEQLKQWVAEGRVYHQTRVQREGTTEWKPLSDFPEWQTDLAPAASLATPAFGAEPPAAVHTLPAFPVIGLLALHFLTCGIFGVVWLNVMHGKMPRVREDDPSAGKAVGFCFIPFFSLYWIFVTFRRLCLRVDEQRELYGLPPSNLTGLATTTCIFMVIPYVNILIGLPIVFPIFAALMQASVNELARESANRAPQRTLPAAAPGTRGGMPGWAIALIVCGCLLLFVAFMSAMLLPALSKAKARAQQISCVNNLKQVGLAFRIWGADHNDEFPSNVSTNEGGTFELCDRDENGFDRNAWAHLRALANELNSTRILICPGDNSKQAATDFSVLQESNISYTFISGTNVSDSYPDMVLAFCPIHHNVALTDGSVQHMSEDEMNAAVKTTIQRVEEETRKTEESRTAGEKVGIVITPDKARLSAYGLTISDVMRAVQNAVNMAETDDLGTVKVRRLADGGSPAATLSTVASIEHRNVDTMSMDGRTGPVTRPAPGGNVEIFVVLPKPRSATTPGAVGTAPKRL
jgi:hypothetical protein